MTAGTYDVRWLQRALKTLGHYAGVVDGLVGPMTNAAIVAFKRDHRLRARPYVGPKTLAVLREAVSDVMPAKFGRDTAPMPPWITEISKHIGLHEQRDNAELSAWLRSDGATLGDPAKLPWCGDAVITALRLTLPDEPLPPRLEANPYWARNFAEFGIRCGHVYGAIGTVTRGKGGHVFFAIGYDPARRRFLALGGNQGDAITDNTWIAESRLLALRWPISWPGAYQRPLPLVDSNGAVLSENEA